MLNNQDYASSACTHLQETTPVQTKCRRCHNRYHNLLHINVQARPNSRWSTNHHRSADEKGNPTAEVNTYCSFKGKPQNQILLATSVVELRKILVSIFHEEHSWTAYQNLTLTQSGVYSV